MSRISISNFGGLFPREKPRSLGGNGAVVNHNLLATQREFRPLQGHEVVGTCPPGTKSIYRPTRNADGTTRTGEGAWITADKQRDYARGQVNDDATERTVVTTSDGTAAPVALTADGQERLLGVPAPLSITVDANEVSQFTREDAAAWLDDEAKPAVQAAIRECLDDGSGSRRYVGGLPVAGSYSMHGMAVYVAKPWNGLYTFPPNLYGTQMATLNIGGNFGDVDSGIPFEIAPVWGAFNAALFRDKLRLIENPKDGSQLFPDDQLNQIATKVAERFSTDQAAVKKWRDELDAAVQRGIKAIGDASHTVAQATARPTEPTKPTGPEWYRVAPTPPASPDEDWVWTRTPEWVQYDEDMVAYEAALRAWESGQATGTVSVADAYATVQQAQRDCERLSNAIEDHYFSLKENIDAAVSDAIGSDFVSNMDVDPDRIIETRFYIATYVTDRGEESAPSPVSAMIEIDQNDSATVGVPSPPPDRHITHWRLYRSSLATTQSEFLFVDEMLITTPSYNDSLKGEALREPCPSMTWLEPPTRTDPDSPASIKPLKGPDPYMRGAVSMPNGITAAFLDNFVAFCEPYRPFAWPVQYQVTTDTPIVGLGVFGQTLFVGTRANPYLVSGSDSANMSAVKLDADQACVSARSIASIGGGVLYASPDGLCHASPSGVQLITGELFAREDWQQINPESIVAMTHENVYYFWCDAGVFALDFTSKKMGTVEAPTGATFKDVMTDHVYVAEGGAIYRLFTGQRMVGNWRSGVMQFQAQVPLAWLQVDGDQTPAEPAIVRWYADGRLRKERTITGIDPVRLPPGRYREHEVEIESTARVTKVTMAGETALLKDV